MALKQPLRIDAGLLVLRLALGAIVLFHGVFKLTHGVGWISGMLQDRGLPGFLAYGVYVAEVVAPLFLFVGAYTRLAALAIVFDMLMAIVMSQHRLLFTLNRGGGWGIEIEAMIFFDALVLALTGGGRYALTGRSASAAGVTGDRTLAKTSSASSTLPNGAET